MTDLQHHFGGKSNDHSTSSEMKYSEEKNNLVSHAFAIPIMPLGVNGIVYMLSLIIT